MNFLFPMSLFPSPFQPNTFLHVRSDVFRLCFIIEIVYMSGQTKHWLFNDRKWLNCIITNDWLIINDEFCFKSGEIVFEASYFDFISRFSQLSNRFMLLKPFIIADFLNNLFSCPFCFSASSFSKFEPCILIFCCNFDVPWIIIKSNNRVPINKLWEYINNYFRCV